MLVAAHTLMIGPCGLICVHMHMQIFNEHGEFFPSLLSCWNNTLVYGNPFHVPQGLCK